VIERPLGSCPSAKGDDLSPINQGFGQNEFLVQILPVQFFTKGRSD
jgi:hypothetical protein